LVDHKHDWITVAITINSQNIAGVPKALSLLHIEHPDHHHLLEWSEFLAITMDCVFDRTRQYNRSAYSPFKKDIS